MINIVRLRCVIFSFIQIICEFLQSKCLLKIDYPRLFIKGLIFDYLIIYREAFRDFNVKWVRAS